MVVVDCLLSNEPTQTLKLTFCKGASKSKYQKVSEAEVKLIDNDTHREYIFKKESDGIWKLDYAALIGHRYSLEINVPGYDTITSESQTLCPLYFKALREDCLGSIRFQAHYHRYDYSPLHYTFQRNIESYTLFICGKYYDKSAGKMMTESLICTDYPTTDDNTTESKYDLDIYPELIGYPLHKEYLSIYVPALENPSNPEAVENYFLYIGGPFKGEYHYSFDTADEHHVLNAGILENPDPTESYIEVTRLNKETETFYFSTLKDYLNIRESSDLSAAYLRDNIYTNIKGAVGYFGCKTVKKLMWSSDPRGDDPFYYDPKDPWTASNYN